MIIPARLLWKCRCSPGEGSVSLRICHDSARYGAYLIFLLFYSTGADGTDEAAQYVPLLFQYIPSCEARSSPPASTLCPLCASVAISQAEDGS